MSLFLLTVVFLLGLAIGVPVAITLGVASLAYILSSGIPLVVVPQKMFAGMDIYVLLCIPGFVLAGNLMNAGAITPRIISFAQAGSIKITAKNSTASAESRRKRHGQ